MLLKNEDEIEMFFLRYFTILTQDGGVMKLDVLVKMKVWPNGGMNIWTRGPRCVFMNLKEKSKI